MEYKDVHEHLETALSQSRFDIGGFISEGFGLWKKAPGSFIGFMLLSFVISMVLSMIPVVGSVISSLFVSSCLSLGAYMVVDRIDAGEGFSFENFFDGFKRIGDVVIQNLIVFVIALVLIIPFAMMVGLAFFKEAMVGDPMAMGFENFNAWSFLALLPLAYAVLLLTFALPILGFYRLNPWESLQYSARFAHKHWIMIFLFFILVSIIVILGLLGLVIGIVVTASMMYPMFYVAFKNVTDWDGFNRQENIDPEIDSLDYFR